MADALGTFGPGPTGVVSAQEHRLAIASMLAGLSTGILDSRTGVFPGPNSLTLVTGTSATAPMTVSIAAHQAATSRTSGQGTYLGPTLEAATTVNIAAAPASNSRIDVVYVVQQDADTSVLSPDASTAPVWAVVTGTAAASPVKPSIPTGALELATVTVAAGATTTNGAGVTIANTVRQTAARGGVRPARSGDTTFGAYDGEPRYNLATKVLELWNATSSTWVPYATTASVTTTSGTLSLVGGWAAFSTYYTPSWYLSADGKRVTLRGMVSRTAANFALGVGSPFQFATLPAALVPSSTVSPLCYVGLGTTAAATYPARLYAPATSALSVVGMDSGSGTMAQNIGFINLDGVGWYL